MKTVITFFVFFVSVNFSVLFSQVTVTPGDSVYTTLKRAFDEINAGTHNGHISIAISGDVTETAMAVLRASGFGAADYNSVKIFPVGGAWTISGSVPDALIKLAGADSVTFDGSIGGVGRNLKIKNTLTTNPFSYSAIWISDRHTAIFPHEISGTKYNVIKNCEISCDIDQSVTGFVNFGISVTGESFTSLSEGEDNDYNQIINCKITKCYFGVFMQGKPANLNDSNIISDNIIGSGAFDSERIGGGGIVVKHQNYCIISKNDVGYVGILISETPSSNHPVGIGVGTTFASVSTNTPGKNCLVEKNYVHNIFNGKGNAAYGIMITTSNSGATDNMISNNVIYDINSNDGTGFYGATGIYHSGGSGDKIVFNSIRMVEDIGTGAGECSGIKVGSTSDSALTIMNNSIYVDITCVLSFLKHYCIIMPSASYVWGSGGCNYNDYYFPDANTKMNIGGIGTAGSVCTPVNIIIVLSRQIITAALNTLT